MKTYKQKYRGTEVFLLFSFRKKVQNSLTAFGTRFPPNTAANSEVVLKGDLRTMNEFTEMLDTAKKMTDVCKQMWLRGLVSGTDGNVSARVSGGNFLVTPSGISKFYVTAKNLVLADDEGVSFDKTKTPSTEFKMHLRCYEERPDVKCIVHAHPVNAAICGIIGLPLDKNVLIEAVLTLGTVPIAPYAAPGTDEVPESLEPYIKSHNAVILKNHGAVTFGRTIHEAYQRMESLEVYAETMLKLHSVNIKSMSDYEISEENVKKLQGI
jgi:L-fuculose-phosphate aldolase